MFGRRRGGAVPSLTNIYSLGWAFLGARAPHSLPWANIAKSAVRAPYSVHKECDVNTND